MKKQLLFVSLLALLTACGEVSTSQTSSTTSEGNSDTTTSIVETSDTPTSSEDSSSSESTTSSEEEPLPEVSNKEKALVKLRTGFAVKTTFTKAYSDGSPSKTYYIDYIKDGVVKSKKFTNETFEKVSQIYQYEKGENDLVKTVSYNIDGSINREPLMLEDSLIGQDVEASWEENGFENAFKLLSEDDFEFDEETSTMTLTFKEDDYFASILKALSVQLFMNIDGYSTHYFIKLDVTAFSMVLSNEATPLSCSLQYEDYDSWGDTVSSSLSCEFLAFGDEVEVNKIVEKVSDDTTLTNKLAKLQENNFKASYYRKSQSWYSDDLEIDTQGEIVSDGQGSFEVTNTLSNNKLTGYKKTDETHYKKYTLTDGAYVFDGDELEGTIASLLPSFKISPAFFTKEETASSTTYTFVLDELMSSKPTVSCFCGFAGAIANNQTFATMTIVVTNESVTFHNDTGGFITDVTYTMIGEVEQISRTIN